MAAEIRTREVIKGTIKTFDRGSAIAARTKDTYVKTKESMESARTADDSSPSSYATDNATQKVHFTAREGAHKANVIGKGTDVLLVACGEMVPYAKKAMEVLNEKGISTGLIDMYCLKPYDTETLIENAKDVKLVVSIEEHAPQGGLGSATAQALSGFCPKRLVELNLPDEHLISGTNKEMFAYYGLDDKGIVRAVEKAL